MAWFVIGVSMVAFFVLVTFLLRRARTRLGKDGKLNVGRKRPGYASDRSILWYWTMGDLHGGGNTDIGGDVGGDGGGDGGGGDGGGFD